MKNKISVVIPCYNEESAIPLFFAEMEKVGSRLDANLDFIFVNDGSSDQTLGVLRQLQEKHP